MIEENDSALPKNKDGKTNEVAFYKNRSLKN